jgi:hypothetical protein
MSRRFAGIIALLVLTVSYAEAGAAAVCDSAMSMKQEVSAQTAGMPMPGHAPAKGSDSNCPYSVPGAAATCIFSIALPAAALTSMPATLKQTASVAEPASSHAILVIRSLFHPPKA